MLRALPERRTDPLITTWLADPDVAAIVGAYTTAMS
jgi:hypothetical protein